MAIIFLNNNTRQEINSAKGRAIWLVLNGEDEGTPEQLAYARRVSKLYLNWRKAPDSYIEAHFEQIARMVLSEWDVNRDGTPTRPSKGDERIWSLSRQMGLYDKGSITNAGRALA
jgi:hypothetical protein